jgi:hypothetical protein
VRTHGLHEAALRVFPAPAERTRVLTQYAARLAEEERFHGVVACK